MQKCPVIIVDFLNTSLETTGQFSLINNAKRIIYVIDEKTQEVLFVNDYTLEKFNNKPYYQKKCYEYMEDLTAPCPWCKMVNSKKNK